jgi:hypothetical protein
MYIYNRQFNLFHINLQQILIIQYSEVKYYLFSITLSICSATVLMLECLSSILIIYSVERAREAVYTHHTDLIVRIVLFPLGPLFCVVFDILCRVN